MVYSTFICLGQNIKTVTVVLPSNLWVGSSDRVQDIDEALQLRRWKIPLHKRWCDDDDDNSIFIYLHANLTDQRQISK